MKEVKKQPYEVFPITINFSTNMASSETVVVATVSATDVTGETDSTVLNGSASFSEKSVTITVQGGTAGNSPYKLTFRCETSTGNKWEDEVSLWVKDL